MSIDSEKVTGRNQSRTQSGLELSKTSGCDYVLITPARNEAQFIESTIKSVVAQTKHPQRWVIVSDGSTDRTNEIVQAYAARYDWIELIATPERNERHFAAKVAAFNLGWTKVTDVSYDVIGNLDADISFDDPTYFEFLMEQFIDCPRLGVAGTAFREGNILYPAKVHSMSDVFGACQMFRRKCFEEIGGYTAVRGGGIDMIAVLAAQAAGWQTRTFSERVCIHHRAAGTAHCSGSISRLFQTGCKDYILGSHPVFEAFRSLYQMTNKPYVIGGALMLIGYLWAGSRRITRPIPQRLVDVRRKVQMSRLLELARQPLSSHTGNRATSRQTT